MQRGQKLAPPALTSNIKSASLDKAFLHRYVIRRGIANTWGVVGLVSLSSVNNSTTVSMAAGGGAHSRAPSIMCSLNQSSHQKAENVWSKQNRSSLNIFVYPLNFFV